MKVSSYSRKLTGEKEFKSLRKKGLEPFEGIRQVAKQANFSLLFGAAPFTFMDRTLIPMWSKQQVEDFIVSKKLETLKDEIITNLTNKFKPIPENIDYLVCATSIRSTFFKKYSGLLERIKRNDLFVREHGYTRTYHGIIRRLPLMPLLGTDDDYKEISGMVNIAANSPIQSLEVARVLPSLTRINRWFRRNGFKSRVWNSVHDSVDFYFYRPELPKIIPQIYKTFEQQEEWQKGVPLTIDLHIADPLKGEIYHGGMEY